MGQTGWFAVRAALTPQRRLMLGIGSFVLPLMLFHQIQLMTCAALARRYAGAQESASHGAVPVLVRAR